MPFDEKSWKLPEAEGLYNPDLEKDACGVGFIVNIDGKKSHKVRSKEILESFLFCMYIGYFIELVSKELNHLAAILHVYAGGLNFMK